MHILVTDVLACPQCDPRFGLVLLADRVLDRRVLEGELGCPNCRERYPIRSGFADLRPPAERTSAAEVSVGGETDDVRQRAATEPDRSTRLAALLGLSEPRRLVVLLGPSSREAAGIVSLVEGIEIVAADASLHSRAEAPGVSRIAVGRALPFLDRTLGALALSGRADGDKLEAAARAIAPLGRLVIEDAPADARTRLAEAGMDVLAAESGTIVAVSKGAV